MRALGLIALALTGLVLGGCGDSPDRAAPGSPDNPLPALPNPAPTRTPPTGEAPAASTSPQTKPRTPTSQAEGQRQAQERAERRRAKTRTTAQTTADVSARKASQAPTPSPRKPCLLVPKADATRILGTPLLDPIHARQGPTCIYRSVNRKRYITLTVQTASYKRLAAQVRGRRTLSIGEYRGVCGTFGGPVLYVPVVSRRVLTIAGPCAVATRFAASALPHL